MADQARGVLSPWLRSRRLAAARPYLRGRVLDVGCGVGALAADVAPVSYLGVDADPESLRVAQGRHPGHRFERLLDAAGGGWDTVVALALIEHVEEPAALLAELAARLHPGGRLVLTTPHPRLRRAHEFGARVGLFSREAAEEHTALLDEPSLRDLHGAAGLRVVVYRRFLGGANQLLVATRTGTA